MMDPKEYQYFIQEFQWLAKIDLVNYKVTQMQRRLNTYMQHQTSCRNVVDFCELLAHDPQELKKLKGYITINVTEFYRDPVQYKQLQTSVLPELLKQSPSLQVWSAGCSDGSEAYTLAMMLTESALCKDFRILATDLDQNILRQAAEGGPYHQNEIKSVPPSMLSKYFTVNDGKYWIVDSLKRKIIFRPQNLLKDKFEKNLDLIVCRNVTIYFTEEAKRHLEERFHESLKMNGILFIGATEAMFEFSKRGFNKLGPSFYRKVTESPVSKPVMAGAI